MTFFYMLKEMWISAKGRRLMVVIFYLLHIISMMGILGQPYVFGQIFNVLQNNNDTIIVDLMYWVGIYVILFIVFNVFHRLGRHIERRVAFRNRQAFINKLYDKLLNIPISWHQDNHSGATINKIKISSEALYQFSEQQFKFIEYFMLFCGPIIILTTLSYQISIVAFILAILTITLISKFDKKIIPLFRAENETKHKFLATIFDYVSNMRTILTLRVNRQIKEELNNKIELAYPVLTESIKIDQYKWACISLCILLLEIGIVFYYIVIKINSNDMLMIGNVAIIFQYLQQLGKMFFSVTYDYQEVIRMKTDYISGNDILGVKNFNNSTLSENIKWKQIDIKNLNFSYKKSSNSIKGINILLKSNSKIALVGTSGSGKSTLLSVIRGLHHTNDSDVFIDNKPSSLASLSSITSLIPQDPEIFENTIEYNICCGVKKLKKDMIQSIKTARLEALVGRLPNGLMTDIREKGANLSGGEKQRIALARGIVAAKDSSILLLDEPTSSIDTYNEELIYKRLFKKFNNKCIISSVHRLHLLDMFDYIYVMSEGKIIQEGTLAQLLASNENNNLFYKLWKKHKK